MLKLIGSVMVFGSCAALGLSARQNLRRRVAAADAMLLALGLIRSEISGRRTPMPEIVGLLTENEQPIVRKVFRTLQRRLREQNGLSLGYLWRSTLRDCRAQVGLGTQECDILCDAANYLGRYDADEQLTGLYAGGAAAGGLAGGGAGGFGKSGKSVPDLRHCARSAGDSGADLSGGKRWMLI